MMKRVLAGISHLALWSGLYLAAAVGAFAQLAGLWPGGEAQRWGAAAGCALFTGTGVYLLDRVKVFNRWLDPADALAHPARAAFIARNAAMVRLLVVALLCIGAVLGARLAWWTVVMVAGAAAGVVVYAGKPRARRARPKDILIVKNMCIAGSITAFAGVLGVLAVGGAADWAVAGVGAAQVFGRIFADAILSDLDDEASDRAFATNTLATRYGREKAWNVATVIRLGLAAALVVTPLGSSRMRWTWAALTVVSTLALRFARPRLLRDWVDARFVAETVAATVILAV